MTHPATATGRVFQKRPPECAGRFTTEATAYHEAGHAAMRLYLEKRVRVVALTPGHDEHLGYVAGYRLSRRQQENRELAKYGHGWHTLLGDIQFLLAGGVAEQFVTGRRNRVGSRSDDERSADVALSMTGSEAEAAALIRWADLRTRNQLRDPRLWAGVRGIAAALLTAGRLTGTEAATAYYRHAGDVGHCKAAAAHLRRLGVIG